MCARARVCALRSIIEGDPCAAMRSQTYLAPVTENRCMAGTHLRSVRDQIRKSEKQGPLLLRMPSQALLRRGYGLSVGHGPLIDQPLRRWHWWPWCGTPGVTLCPRDGVSNLHQKTGPACPRPSPGNGDQIRGRYNGRGTVGLPSFGRRICTIHIIHSYGTRCFFKPAEASGGAYNERETSSSRMGQGMFRFPKKSLAVLWGSSAPPLVHGFRQRCQGLSCRLNRIGSAWQSDRNGKRHRQK